MARLRTIIGLTAAVLATAGGCVQTADELPLAADDSALIGGTEATPDDDPAVVALTTSGFPFCTGTLISPRVVLTAAHCVDMGGDNTVYFGHDVQAAGRRIEVVSTKTHPEWTGSLGNNDIGVVLLKFPQDPELAIPLNRSPASDHVDDPYRIVGFGQSSVDPDISDGKKRTGLSTITGVQSGDVLLTGDETVRVCFGDSGGPGFLTIDDVEYIAGVHSFTMSQQCFAPMGDTRVDLHVDDFIQPFIDANDTTCKEDGICARIGCVDDPDCLPCGPNGECVADCPLPDWDCATQAMGDVCQADTQCDTGLCVFWQPQPETKFCTVPCTPGGSECPSGMTCQDRPDVGNVCYYAGGDDEPPGLVGDECSGPIDCGSQRCEDGFCTTECDGINNTLLCPLGSECENRTGEFLCYVEQTDDGGGCQVGTDSNAPTAWLLALVGLALVRRRRTRT